MDAKKWLRKQWITHADETERIECKTNDGRQLTVHVMECSACGGTYEHVWGDYVCCPICGRLFDGR